MSLTFPAAHAAKLHSDSVTEDWLFHLYYDDDDDGVEDGFIALSGKDRTISSVNYFGIVIDSGSISRRIDLVNSVAAIDDIQITCTNKFRPTNSIVSHLSAELFPERSDAVGISGQRRYINHTVKIYSCLNDETTLSNCALIWRGKIKSISHTLDTVTINFEQNQPFRDIKIPNTRSTNFNVWQPVVYGNFTKETSGQNQGYAYVTDAVLHPVPVLYSGFGRIWCVNHQADSSDARLHLFEKNARAFVPVEIPTAPYYDDTTESRDGLNCSFGQSNLHHGWYQRPIDVDTDNDEFTNSTNAFDDNTGSYAEAQSSGVDVTGTGSHVASDTSDLVLVIPKVAFGKVTTFKVRVTYILSGVYQVFVTGLIGNGGGSMSLYDYTYSGDPQEIETIATAVTDRGSDDTIPFDSGVAATVETDWSSNLAADNYVLPDTVVIRGTTSQVGTGTNAADRSVTTGDYYIHDVTLVIDAYLDEDNDPSNAANTVSQVINLYSGSDGYDADFTNGSGSVAGEIHEMHRDLMDRFGGLDYADTYMENWDAAAPGDYDLDTARSGWNVRWWQLEPRDLKEILDILQFEGCFIFIEVADSDGSGNPGGRYIWVQNSYASVDATLTEDDYVNLKLSTIDMSEIVTKTTYYYNRHPAEDKFQQVATLNNTTDRDRFGISTSQDQIIELEALVNCGDNTDSIYDTGSSDGDNAPNESIAVYYNRIRSQPRIIANLDIKNKFYFYLEIGDMIHITHDEVNIFGDTSSGIYFMIVSENRSKDILSITAQEVYNA